MKDGPVFYEKWVREDVIFSSMMTPGKKMKEVIVDGHVLDKNLLHFFQIRPQLAVIASARSRLKRKIENLKNIPRRCLRFSLLVTLMKKLREVFVIQPVLRKKLSRIFKICLRLPIKCLERTHSKIDKNGKNMQKWFFFVLSGIPDPPPSLNSR
jgi:hypothetical protein